MTDSEREEKLRELVIIQAKHIDSLEETIRWMAQTVHQGNHQEFHGDYLECPRSVCDVAKQISLGRKWVKSA